MKTLLLLCALLAGCDNSPTGIAKQKERDVIAICHGDMQKKSLDPATLRFVAGTCEMLEQKFKSTYHVNP